MSPHRPRAEDVFPLPHVVALPSSRFRSGRYRQRHQDRVLAARLCNIVSSGLNTMSSSPSSVSPRLLPHCNNSNKNVFAQYFTSASHVSLCQRRVLGRIISACRRFISRRPSRCDHPGVPAPSVSSSSSSSSFSVTSSSSSSSSVSSSFSSSSSSSSSPAFSPYSSPVLRDLAESLGAFPVDLGSYVNAPRVDALPLVADVVSLPERAATCPLLDILPPDLAAKFAREDGGLVRPASERAEIPKAVNLVRSGEYVRLLRRLRDCGLLAFTLRPKAVNGLFGVPKDITQLRLIVDARPANAMFVDPPKVQLPTPDLLAQMTVPAGAEIFVAKADIDGCYHRLLLPEWLWPYFALPAVSIADMPELRADFPTSETVYPCFRTVPMGWSHSVYAVQRAHEFIAASESGLQRDDRISPGNDCRVDRPRHFIYIDDTVFLATSQHEADALLAAHLLTLSRHRLDAKPSKVVPATSAPTEIIGIELDGQRGTLGVSPPKLRRLCSATMSCIEKRAASGYELSVLVGCWTWAMLAARPAFSVFSSVYRFVASAGSRVVEIWPSVVAELQLILALSPLLFVSLRSDFAETMVATDASTTGQGVVYASVSPAAARNVAALSSVADLAADGSDSAPDIVSRFALRSFDADPVAPVLRGRNWKTAVSARWSRSEHINVLELRAMCTAVRWACSRPSFFCRRLLLLSDSHVAVCAVAKGRSSSQQLRRRLRFVSGFLLAFNLRLSVRWIPTETNPADGPSRL